MSRIEESKVQLVKAAKHLRFPANEERLFWLYFHEKSLVLSRLINILAIVFLTFYIINDYLCFSPYTLLLFLLRLITMLPHAAYVLRSFFLQKRGRFIPHGMMVVTFIISSLIQQGMLAMAPTDSLAYHHYWVANCVYITVYFTGCRTRLQWALAASCITVITWNIVAVFVQNWHQRLPNLLISNNLFLVSLMVLCTFIAYNSEYTHRLSFIHRYIAELLNKQLEEMRGFKTRMISLVAHDLRNPLSSMSMSAQLGLRHLVSGNQRYTHQALDDIIILCSQMNMLLNDIVDLAAIESGALRLRKEKLDFSALLPQMLERHQIVAGEKQQQIISIISPDCFLMADPIRLQQIVDNLCSNAIKYSQTQTTIAIRLNKKAEGIRLEVEDEGPGLTEEDKTKVFGFFQRLSARPTNNEPSSGIGLFNVKHLVELHGGTVSVISRAGEGIQGATFVVELPYGEV